MTGEALEQLAAIDSETVDAIITDPPYCSGAITEAGRTNNRGQGLRSETLAQIGWFRGDAMGTSGLVWTMRCLAVAAYRLLRETGHLLVFCDWRMVPNLAPAIESSGMRYQGLIVWNKGYAGLGRGFRCQHELILHYTAGSPEYFATDVGNVVTAARIRSTERIHWTQKPVPLLRDLVRVTVPEGGLVIDPFCGSGSTLAAAASLGRNALGIERDPDIADIARERLSLRARVGGQALIFETEGGRDGD